MSHPRTSSGRRYTGARRVLPRLLRLPVALVVAAVLVLVLGAGSALGTPEHLTHTWTGAGFGDTWSTFTNWTPEISPSAADSLVFPAVATSKTSMNDLAPGTPFGSVQIDGSGYTFLGNAIQLDGGITATFASATQEFPLDVALTAPTTMAVDSSSATLTLSGTVSGSSSLTKTGEGTLALTGTPSLTGTLTISAGMLRVDGTTTAPVAVKSGGDAGRDRDGEHGEDRRRRRLFAGRLLHRHPDRGEPRDAVGVDALDPGGQRDGGHGIRPATV